LIIWWRTEEHPFSINLMIFSVKKVFFGQHSLEFDLNCEWKLLFRKPSCLILILLWENLHPKKTTKYRIILIWKQQKYFYVWSFNTWATLFQITFDLRINKTHICHRQMHEKRWSFKKIHYLCCWILDFYIMFWLF